MIIRKSTPQDLQAIMNIYAGARAFMQSSGNPNQWKDGHPAREMVERDIQAGSSYVCVHNNDVAAVFYYGVEIEPTYLKIDGKWLNDEPYGVVHRIARSGGASGAGAFCLDWCYEQCHNLRLDTHRDNAPMRNLLDRLDFSYCGIIWLANGDERLAYQKADVSIGKDWWHL